MLLEIHAQATTHSYSTVDFGEWWDGLEEAGLRAFSSELNYPAIHCEYFGIMNEKKVQAGLTLTVFRAGNPFPTAM